MTEQLAAAVRQAQIAQLNLTGLMAAYRISQQDLGRLLEWPAPVTAAFSELEKAIRPLARLLAEQDGKAWQWLSLPELSAYVAKAHELVMDSPVPDVGHASGVAPIRVDTA